LQRVLDPSTVTKGRHRMIENRDENTGAIA
jgi:hypothetical protein